MGADHYSEGGFVTILIHNHWYKPLGYRIIPKGIIGQSLLALSDVVI
jgi:hypothetical protein